MIINESESQLPSVPIPYNDIMSKTMDTEAFGGIQLEMNMSSDYILRFLMKKFPDFLPFILGDDVVPTVPVVVEEYWDTETTQVKTPYTRYVYTGGVISAQTRDTGGGHGCTSNLWGGQLKSRPDPNAIANTLTNLGGPGAVWYSRAQSHSSLSCSSSGADYCYYSSRKHTHGTIPLRTETAYKTVTTATKVKKRRAKLMLPEIHTFTTIQRDLVARYENYLKNQSDISAVTTKVSVNGQEEEHELYEVSPGACMISSRLLQHYINGMESLM